VLGWLLRSLCADGTCDLPIHVVDLLLSDMCILTHVMLVIRINFYRVHRSIILTHYGRVTKISVFNTVKLGTSASSP
jgi:hypothetical protein